jgi:hypothetical protein
MLRTIVDLYDIQSIEVAPNLNFIIDTDRSLIYFSADEGHEVIKKSLPRGHKFQYHKCALCATPRPDIHYSCPPLHSQIEVTGIGMCFICRDCLRGAFVKWAGFVQNPREAIFFLCYALDYPHILKIADNCANSSRDVSVCCSNYIRMVNNMLQYRHLCFADSDKDVDEQIAHIYIPSQTKRPGRPKNVTTQMTVDELQNRLGQLETAFGDYLSHAVKARTDNNGG